MTTNATTTAPSPIERLFRNGIEIQTGSIALVVIDREFVVLRRLLINGTSLALTVGNRSDIYPLHRLEILGYLVGLVRSGATT